MTDVEPIEPNQFSCFSLQDIEKLMMTIPMQTLEPSQVNVQSDMNDIFVALQTYISMLCASQK